MKKALIVLLTMVVEVALIWGVAVLLNRDLMEILFLGGLLIFGVIWIFSLFTNQVHNQLNVGTKGWTGQDAGGIKLFQFRMSPVKLGTIAFLVVTFAVTAVYYSDYFI